jgi:hypothetical protein
MRLGAYAFEWNPDEVDIPESKKTVATQETFEGSAIFMWGDFLEGTKVQLEWDWMPEGMYQSLRGKYLSLDKMRWVSEPTSAFDVYVETLEGEYFETGLHELPYRRKVRMRLNLRNTTSAVTTTTA